MFSLHLVFVLLFLSFLVVYFFLPSFAIVLFLLLSNATGLISVTKVHVTPDLKYAKVYVSILNSKNINETLEALKKSSGFIRSGIAKSINLRITPELVFELDDSIEYGSKIDSILKEIMPLLLH